MSTIRVLLCMLGLCMLSCSSQAEEPVMPSQTTDNYETAPLSGTVYLWSEGNMPDCTHPTSAGFDPVDFRPNMEVFTVGEDVKPKGAVLICPGGAFQFRSMQPEGYSVVRALRNRGYQCFVVNYRVRPWTMEEGSLDLARSIRYVRTHADEYRIRPADIATVGFSAGGILCGDEVWHYSQNDGTALDAQYQPDALDLVDARPAAVGMIYAFYGRLSVAERNVDNLRDANLPPTFYAYGTEDPFYSQFNQQVTCMQQAGYTVEQHVLQGWPHGFGTGGRDDVWVADFDAWMQKVFAQTADDVQPYTRQTRINDVMNDPAFGDYGRLIFPVNTGYWSGTTLEQLQLTWYNYIDPDKTVEVCNYLRAHANNCFIDIYTEVEKQANPNLRNTGVFFFRGNRNAPFAICNAGGGFSYVGAMHDSFPHALELSKLGYNAFALIYRPSYAYEDLARAITYICDHADELGVSRTGYSLWGGSAGARMAATLGNSANLHSLTGRTDLPQASAVIMQYTGYTTVSQYDGPTYACCGTSDGIASWRTMQSRLESLSALGIPTEFHSYNGLPHGFGLGTGTVAEGWLTDAVHFWQQQSGATAIHSAKSNTKQQNSIYSLNGTRRNAIQKGINIVGGKTILK